MKLVILGAHSAVGEAVAEAFAERDIDTPVVRATTSDHIEVGLDLVDADLLSDALAVFVCFDNKLVRGLVERLDPSGSPGSQPGLLSIPFVDLVGLARSAPLVFPRLDGPTPLGPGFVRVPLGMVGPVTAALRALEAFGPERASVVTFEGVAGAGRPGFEELSAQTRGIFSQNEVAPEVFYAPLAFGVLSSLGDREEPFGPDTEFAEDIRAGLRSTTLDITVARTRVPAFTGEGAWIQVVLRDPPERETVIDLLSEARGLRRASTEAPGTLESVDRDDALFGRVRVQATSVDLWLVGDRLRQGAALSAALLAEAEASRTGST